MALFVYVIVIFYHSKIEVFQNFSALSCVSFSDLVGQLPNMGIPTAYVGACTSDPNPHPELI